MRINSKELLQYAKENRFAVPSANFIDLNSARTYVQTAEEQNLPLILSYAQSHATLLSLEEAAAIGTLLADAARVPVVLHLDHGEDKETVYRAINLGFRSVMIDASMAEFEKNIAITKEIVDYAHERDVTVEAELGHVGANDTSESAELTDSVYTEVNDVLEFEKRTGCDSLAVSIGTAHGLYKGIPKINFERLSEIASLTDLPLVLHGGSSSGDENLNRCAVSGIAKINIYTDFIVGAFNAIKEEKPAEYVELKEAADRGMAEVLRHYYRVFETKPFER